MLGPRKLDLVKTNKSWEMPSLGWGVGGGLTPRRGLVYSLLQTSEVWRNIECSAQPSPVSNVSLRSDLRCVFSPPPPCVYAASLMLLTLTRNSKWQNRRYCNLGLLAFVNWGEQWNAQGLYLTTSPSSLIDSSAQPFRNRIRIRRLTSGLNIY